MTGPGIVDALKIVALDPLITKITGHLVAGIEIVIDFGVDLLAASVGTGARG